MVISNMISGYMIKTLLTAKHNNLCNLRLVTLKTDRNIVKSGDRGSGRRMLDELSDEACRRIGSLATSLRIYIPPYFETWCEP